MRVVTALLLAVWAAPAHAGLAAFADASAELGAEPVGPGDGAIGVATLDYDNDGDLDLFFTNGPGHSSMLFRNDGAGGLVRAELEAGAAVFTGNSAVLAADLTGDGWVDLLLTGTNGVMFPPPTPMVLLINDGDGTFTDRTAGSGLAGTVADAQAAAGDYDGDGDLDVFVGSAGSLATREQSYNQLFRNDGAGVFTNVAAEAGVRTNIGACAASFTHLDGDEHLDLLVANCNEVRFASTPNEPFFNNGDGTFDNGYDRSQIWRHGYWMGLAPGDFNGDALQDYFITNTGVAAHPHGLFLSTGSGTWEDRAVESGVADWPFGWGAVGTDFDNDGHLDLYYVGASRFEQMGPSLKSSPGLLFANRGDGTFDAPATPLDLEDRYTTGVSQADLDGDGFPEILVGSSTVPDLGTTGVAILLRNQGNANHWLTVRLRDEGPNRAGIGARIYATSAGRTQLREVIAGSSFASTESPWPTFGLGAETEVQVCVRWPDGAGEDFGVQPADGRVDLVRGAGIGEAACTPGDVTSDPPRHTADTAVPDEPDGPTPEADCGCSSGAPMGGVLSMLRRR